MSNAFEITNEDVEAVLTRMAYSVYIPKIDEVADLLNMDCIEDAALFGDDMEEQLEYAYDEIESQIREMAATNLI